MDDEAHHNVVSREFEKMVCCCFREEMAIECEMSRTTTSIGRRVMNNEVMAAGK